MTTALCLCTWDIHADSCMHSSCCLQSCCAWPSILTLTSPPHSPDWAHHCTSTTAALAKLIFSPKPHSPPCRYNRPPNKSPNTRHHLSGSLWLTSKPTAPACLAVISAQHASLASLPMHSSGLAPLLMLFQFPLLFGSSFSCVQTATLRPALSGGSPESWQARHGLVTP